MILDLGLANGALYSGLAVERLAGRPTLLTPPAEAIPVLAANLAAMEIDSDEVVLTGAMAVWAYLVVFHLLHGRTRRIYYQDGRGERLLVAAHG
ncbi:MAG TPA: hypothetical protein VJA16_16220 [Thermoanaerobaculia bacterium]